MSAAPRPLRVLVADDDFHVARLHAAVVDATEGFVALPPMGSGEAVLRAVPAAAPDLVLLDVYMPDMNGLDVLARIDIDAFVVSAASDQASVRRALRRGALSYLIKPFPEELLRRRLQGYLRFRQLLADGPNLDQDAVERALRMLHPGDRSTGRPRAVTELSVLEALRNAVEPLSAADVAAAVGVSRATAQRYLSGLVDDGAASVQLRYGAAGRPEHRYGIRPE
ncbi:MAG: response regulator [Microbacteriaceae bacterium]|nr:response regulator [Microbacteriaceae bacterium]MCL2795695.1 response regulator [Microbacteriaceae bacterium]